MCTSCWAHSRFTHCHHVLIGDVVGTPMDSGFTATALIRKSARLLCWFSVENYRGELGNVDFMGRV